MTTGFWKAIITPSSEEKKKAVNRAVLKERRTCTYTIAHMHVHKQPYDSQRCITVPSKDFCEAL